MYGGNVIEPSSAFEEEQLKILVPETYPYPTLWLGINDLRKFGHFVKESDGSRLTYTNWDNKGSPVDNIIRRGKDHCTVMPMVTSIKGVSRAD